MRLPHQLVSVVLILVMTASVDAKPPSLTSLFPAGGRQGTTTLVTAAGSFDHWPARGWAEVKGIHFVAAETKGKLWVSIDDDVPPGCYWVRLADDEGASPPRLFQVGTLPETSEVEPNNTLATAQRLVDQAVTINGKLSRGGDIDSFALSLTRGQTLVASMEANRRLGYPMDGLLQVVSPDGFVVADNDDDRERDPQIVFTAPADGVYVVRTYAFPATPDSRIGFSGGDAYIYRLTITTRGFLDHPFPLAVARDGSPEVRAEGWNIDEASARLEVASRGDDVAHVSHRSLGGAGEVTLASIPTSVEHEPNSVDAPQSIPLPNVISGRIDPPGDWDVYRFHVSKGVKYVARIESRALGLPLDPTLRLIDSEGKIVSEIDDTSRRGENRDAELTFTPSADADQRLVVRDLYGAGGPRYVYRLTVEPVVPSVRLTVASDRLTVSPGKPASVKVTIDRRDGYAEPLKIEAEGLPKGLTARGVVSEPKGDSSRSVTLTIEANSPTAAGAFRITGRKDGDPGPPQVATAKVDELNSTIREIWISSTPPPKDSAKK